MFDRYRMELEAVQNHHFEIHYLLEKAIVLEQRQMNVLAQHELTQPRLQQLQQHLLLLQPSFRQYPEDSM